MQSNERRADTGRYRCSTAREVVPTGGSETALKDVEQQSASEFRKFDLTTGAFLLVIFAPFL